VPVRDEEGSVDALLTDLRAQLRPPAAVVLADMGSRDRTRDVVAEHARQDARITLLSLPPGFPGAGRNAGLRAARTEWVAFVDAGVRVPPDFLARLMAPVDAGQPVDLVLGNMDPVMETRAQRAAALAYVPARRALPDGASWRGPLVHSSAVRRAAAFDAGGFAEALRSGEDLLFLRALQSRCRTAQAPAARVRWLHTATTGGVWRRFRAYAAASLRAGLMDDWFAVMRRRYTWMLLLGPAYPLGVFALLLARAVAMQRRKPEMADPRAMGRAWQVLEVALYLGIIDAATWSAWIGWRRGGRERLDTRGALRDENRLASAQETGS
jgi:glycosyltransferase involved in cell wall biosynthesis